MLGVYGRNSDELTPVSIRCSDVTTNVNSLYLDAITEVEAEVWRISNGSMSLCVISASSILAFLIEEERKFDLFDKGTHRCRGLFNFLIRKAEGWKECGLASGNVMER
ncbi:hypothetical protein CC2G_012524 [Coprinopsis cinerea AmutBmut pab1-1]|nr:hypothetical protein CC2G_012524 [Coprinopsis cinerea AmutBmut pab1-1]